MLFQKNAMMIKMTEIVVALTQSNLSMPDTTVTEKSARYKEVSAIQNFDFFEEKIIIHKNLTVI